jgi:bifunctional DNase/RNase
MQIEMTIKGLMVDPITNMPIVILRDRDGQRVLPIWVGIFEANAIALQIENISTPRPMTHDLLRNVIQDLKASVQKIVVCDLQENTFYALIYLTLNGDTLAIDARPSDAIALALRTRAAGSARRPPPSISRPPWRCAAGGPSSSISIPRRTARCRSSTSARSARASTTRWRTGRRTWLT